MEENPSDGFRAQERCTAPFYAKITAAAGARGGVSAVSIGSGGAHNKSRELKDIYNKQYVIKLKDEHNICLWCALAIATMGNENRHIKNRQ